MNLRDEIEKIILSRSKNGMQEAIDKIVELVKKYWEKKK